LSAASEKTIKAFGGDPSKSLAERFEESCAETWRLADELVMQRAEYEKSCAPGLPMQSILLEIQKHSTCRCFVTQDVIRKNGERAEFEGRP
jgi:hypothetical protein